MNTDLQKRWSLSDIHIIKQTNHNFVARAYNNRQYVIVKINKNTYQRELRSLRAYNNHGAVKRINHNDEHRALLLEYIQPGTTLCSANNTLENNAYIFSQVMSKLHQASSKSAQLPCIEQNLGSIDYNTIIQKKYLIKAQGIAKELLRMSITPVVLHADLHYKNILLSSKEWIAIDPHGLIGDPAYELGAYVRNFIRLPCSSNELKHVINKKLSLCSYYTDLDIHRLQA